MERVRRWKHQCKVKECTRITLLTCKKRSKRTEELNFTNIKSKTMKNCAIDIVPG